MLNRPRVIPILGIINDDLVKTTKYKDPRYLGDPINAVKIFNGKGVDELSIIDIRATMDNTPINFDLLKNIAQQAFMPLSYGGGIKSISEIKRLFKIGFEKVIIGTSFFENPALIKEASEYAGSQSIVVSIDVKKTLLGKYQVFTTSGTKKANISLEDSISLAISQGAGEIILNVIDRDGTMIGYDLDLVEFVSKLASIPIIANNGASDVNDIKKALNVGAHAAAASSIFVYYGKRKAVLITFPSESDFFIHGVY